jgi:hypothetical protein
MEPFYRFLLFSYFYPAGKTTSVMKLSLKTTVLLIFFTLPVILATGCAQMYHGFQAQSVDSCYHLPYSEQQECLERVRSSYEAYEQERKKKGLSGLFFVIE